MCLRPLQDGGSLERLTFCKQLFAVVGNSEKTLRYFGEVLNAEEDL